MAKLINQHLKLYKTLKKLDFFSRLTKSVLWPLANLATFRHFKPNEFLIVENNETVGIFIIVKGSVLVFKTLDDGQEFILTELTTGQIIGENSIFDKSITTASVRALEEVECIFISGWDFNTQIHAYPQMGLQLLTILAERIRIIHDRIKSDLIIS